MFGLTHNPEIKRDQIVPSGSVSTRMYLFFHL